METVKIKFNNLRNERIKFIYKDVNLILSLKYPISFYRELASSKFISNFKNTKKPGTYKCSDKRCKICQNYLNETNTFTMSNGQIWKSAEKLTVAC